MAAVSNNRPIQAPPPPPPPPPKVEPAKAAGNTPQTDKAQQPVQQARDGFDSQTDAHLEQQQNEQRQQQVQQSRDASLYAASPEESVPELSGNTNPAQGTVQIQSIPGETSGGEGVSAASGVTAASGAVTGRGPNDHPDAPTEHHSVNNLGQGKYSELDAAGTGGQSVRDGTSTVETRDGNTVPKKNAEGKTMSAEELLKGNGGERYENVYPSTSKNAKDPAQLGRDKERVFNAALDQGATRSEAAVLTAQLSQEGELDKAKDGKAGATNYGPFNLNQDLLKKYGGDPSNPSELSSLSDEQLKAKFNPGTDGKYSDGQLTENIEAARNAMKNLGVDNYLHHVRGGDTGFKNPNEKATTKTSQNFDGRTVNIEQDDNHRFARNIANAAMDVLYDYDQGRLGDPTRYAADIPNI